MFTFVAIIEQFISVITIKIQNTMKMTLNPKKTIPTLLILSAGFLGTSCIDSNYDFSEDIDLTMGLGAEGLTLKVGSTGKFLVKDILQVDNTIKLDQNNTYYLVEEGTTSTEFHIADVSAEIDAATLSTHQRVVTFDDILDEMGIPDEMSVPVTQGFCVKEHGEGETDKFNFHVKDIQKDITQISKVFPVEGTHIRLDLKLIEPKSLGFALSTIENLQITMPEYLVIKSVEHGTFKDNVITIPRLDNPEQGSFCDIVVDHLNLGKDGVINNQELTLPTEKNLIKMSGDFTFAATRDFTMSHEDYIDVELDITITSDASNNKNKVEIEKVTGKFNPHIDPITEKINIADNLPDFLQDERVSINVSNPTLKFDADLTNIPLTLDFSGELRAVRDGDDSFTKTVTIPADKDEVILKGGQHDLIYFHQGDRPYDPTIEGEPAGEWLKIPNLSSLIEKVPDYVEVNIADGKIHVDQSQEYTIHLGHDYHADLAYSVFVPFEFKNGVCLILKESTESFGENLKDFQAEGLQVTGKILSTVPMNITGTAVPVDAQGNPVEGININTIQVPASDGTNVVETEVLIDITLSDPALLHKVDHLTFEFKTESADSEVPRSLKATQYLQVQDLRLKLKGQIIANFN